MSYFDHVKCHHCGAQLDPDNLSAGMTCPRCNGQLSLQDLFGVKDAFVGMDDGGNDLGLDDLLAPGRNNPYADDPLKQGGGYAYSGRGQGGGHREEAPRAARPSQGAPSRPAPPSRPALGMGRSSADTRGQGMVHVPRQGDEWDEPQQAPEEEIGGSSSALDLMRKMKKRR